MMKIAQLEPFSEFDRMNRVFDRLFNAPTGSATSQILPIDLVETDSALMVRASVPGLGPDEIDVTVEDNVLTLRGEHGESQIFENAKVYRREISTGRVMRSIRLPEGYDLDRVEASFDKGIVTVTLPKLEEVKPKTQRIPVRSVESAPAMESVETEVVEKD